MAKLSSQTKYLLGCGTFLILCTIGFVAFFTWKIVTSIDDLGKTDEAAIPQEIREPRVLKGFEFLTKSDFFKLKKGKFLDGVSIGATASDDKEKTKRLEHESGKGIFRFSDMKICGNEIVVVAQNGGYVFDKSGNLSREIWFEPTEQMVKVWWWKQFVYHGTTNNIRIIDIENDGKCEFTSYSSVDGFAVFDSEGNGLWRYGQRMKEIDLEKIWKEKEQSKISKESYISAATVFDIEGDGISEFIVSEKDKGIKVFNSSFDEKWTQTDEDPTANLQLIDVDGDGKSEIFEFQGMSSKIRDKTSGNVIKNVEINGWQKEILPFENETKIKGIRFFEIDNDKLKISDLNNKILQELEAPLSKVKSIKDKNEPKAKYQKELPKPSQNVDKNGTRAETKRIKPSNYNAPVGPAPHIATKQVEEFDTFEDTESLDSPKALWIKLKKDKPKFLAVIASFIGTPRANFYLYEANGNLVYHELLPEEADTVLVVPDEAGNESLLIGGKETIWKFEIKTDQS